ncbi:MAG: hypothetical protein AUK47_12225 [Deltaproteobacteria bacterium CG2_30_63_29]|nr:MAG: hypothetical protein AUK47_12225 [Deltaproteobacteria bacterium CG2_30_63_29]
MNLLLRWRWLGFVAIGLVVVAMLPGLKTAAVPDNALTVWFLESDPQLAAYHEFQQEFGNDEVILILVEPKDGVFAPSSLRKLADMSAQIEEVEGVHAVHSLLTVKDVWETEEGLKFEPLLPHTLPDDDALLREAARRARDNALFTDRLVSADGQRALVWVQMAVMDDIDAKRDAIVAEVTHIVDAVQGDEPHALGGNGVIYSGLNLITQHDFGLFISIGYLVMFLLMGWVFRKVRLVVAAIGVILVGTIVCLGMYGWMGHQLNMVTVVLPILVIVLGVADAVHFPSAFVLACRDFPGESRALQVMRTLRRVWLPCLLTTLTTMAGFLALASSPMAVTQQLGIYAAIGLGTALVASFVFMVIAFMSFGEGEISLPSHGLLQRFLGIVEGWILTRKAVLLALTLVLTGLSAWGAWMVETDTYTIGYLPDDSRVVVDHETIESDWGAYSVLEFMVRPKDGRKMDDPEVLAGMERFVAAASKHDQLRDGFSLSDVYRRMAAVWGAPELGDKNGAPLTPEQIDQLTLMLSSQRLEWDRDKPAFDDNFLAPIVTKDRKLGRLTLVGNMMSAKDLDALLHWLHERGVETMGDVAELEPSGYPPLYVKIIDYVMSSQIRSFFIALGFIFLLMWVGFRSLRLALASLLPNLFPVLVMMGIMGFLGIHLDVATATVGAIVIGVSIDDTVHFLHHWKRAEIEGMNWSESVTEVLRRAGVPAVITTLLLICGFPVLMLASVKTVVYFGLLTTIAAAAALFGDLFILPMLLKGMPARRKQA